MANLSLKRKQNNPGHFYVDSTCIDCGTCYWVAPESFQYSAGQAKAVNPSNQDKNKAFKALFSCPTQSIGVTDNHDAQGSRVLSEIPYPIIDEVYHCAFHSKDSYGATSYLIKNPNGNILIDSPRFSPHLEKKISQMGGLSWQLLTHKDDVADSDRYNSIFKSNRCIHKDDSNSKTSAYELLLEGDEIIGLTKDIQVIPVPGHTKGSVCYLYKEKYLFTGDHLAFSYDLGHLYAFKDACWYDFREQTESMKKLLNFSLEAILPGHGAPMLAPSQVIKKSLEACIKWMESQV